MVNIRAKVAGHTEESGAKIHVDAAKLDIAESLGMLVPETGSPDRHPPERRSDHR